MQVNLRLYMYLKPSVCLSPSLPPSLPEKLQYTDFPPYCNVKHNIHTNPIEVCYKTESDLDVDVIVVGSFVVLPEAAEQ